MTNNPQHNNDWASLPVLTEIVGDISPKIPLLTEEASNKQKLAQKDGVLEMSAEEIAELLAPQLEKQLRAKMNKQFEAMWQATWLQARASLPELIHAQLSASSKGLAGSKASGLDIITPRTPASGAKKSNTGKASSTKAASKEPKNK